MNDSDELLLARCRQRDNLAFERLFLRHYADIYRLIYSLVRNRELAEDLTQETFLMLYRRPPRVNGAEGLKAWLRRVALNGGYNALRNERRLKERLARLPEPPPSADPQAEALRSEESAWVREILMRLPARQRDLLLLRQAELSYAEIAHVLNVAPGSVGTLLARAERAFIKVYEDGVMVRNTPGPLKVKGLL